MIKILIVEEDFNISKKVINKLSKIDDHIKICGIATNLSEFYNSIEEYPFDVLIINFEILKMIEYSYLTKFNKSIIVLSSKQSIIDDMLDTSNIYEFIIKPNNIDSISQKITEIIKNKNTNDIKNLISNELNYLGYNPSHKGYQYLLEAIYILNDFNDYYEDNLSKNIYPIIAKQFKTTPLNVKYNIRNATESMYYCCKQKKLQEYLKIEFIEKPKLKTIILAIVNNIYKKIHN